MTVYRSKIEPRILAKAVPSSGGSFRMVLLKAFSHYKKGHFWHISEDNLNKNYNKIEVLNV